jgi:hypothetical protein
MDNDDVITQVENVTPPQSEFRYRKIYKYSTEASLRVATGVKGYEAEVPGSVSPWVSLDKDGTLFIKEGYSWDGASGVPDTRWNLRGSLVHDALYQLIREGYLPKAARAPADSTFGDYCLKDGSGRALSWIFWAGVRVFGWMCV